MAALVVPFLFMAVSLVSLKRNPFRPPEWDHYEVRLSATAGFLLLGREFRLRASGIAIVHFRAMLSMLFVFTVTFVGMVYGNML